MSAPEVSIVIVNFKSGDLLRDCLDKVFESRNALSVEVIVVDNCSSGDCPERIRNRHPEVRFICNDLNLGFATAVNQGIRASSGRFILAMNPDTRFLQDGIGRLIAFAEEKFRAENAGIFGCRLLNSDGTLQFSKGRFPTLARTLFDVLKPRRWRKYDHSGYDSASEPDWVTGACILIRREVIEEVGLLDENYFMYYEDVDLCYRARKKGFRVLYFPGTHVYHFYPHSQRRGDRDFIPVEIRRSHLYFYRKHYSRAAYCALWCLTVGFAVGLAAMSPLRSVFKPGTPAGNTGARLLKDLFLNGFGHGRAYSINGTIVANPDRTCTAS